MLRNVLDLMCLFEEKLKQQQDQREGLSREATRVQEIILMGNDHYVFLKTGFSPWDNISIFGGIVSNKETE